LRSWLQPKRASIGNRHRQHHRSGRLRKYTVITAIPGYELEPPYNVLKPLDIKPDEEPQWSGEAESAATELKREAATEIRIDKNLDLAVKLHPAPAR